MMKRLLTFILTILLISGSVATVIFAAEAGGNAASPASTKTLETVEVIFSVPAIGEISSMAVEYDVPTGLKLVEAKWLLDGAINDIDTIKQRGVLAFEENTNLISETEIFVIRYQVLEDVEITFDKPFEATATLKVQYKLNNAETKEITVTEEIVVTAECDHPSDQREMRDSKDATCLETGYTGDLWCKQCNTMLNKGKETSTTNEHTPGTEWESDKSHHWHVCNICTNHVDKAAHEFKDNECQKCHYKHSEGVVWGDADGNGAVDASDATVILQYCVNLISATDFNMSVCDLDGSGEVDAADATLVLQYCVELITKFPVEK